RVTAENAEVVAVWWLRGSWRHGIRPRLFHDAEPAAQAPLEHSGWQKRLESSKSNRFPADQMAQCGCFARHDPTHACSDLGGVDSLLDIARQARSESAPQSLIDLQWRAHHARIRRKAGSNESRFYQRDT